MIHGKTSSAGFNHRLIMRWLSKILSVMSEADMQVKFFVDERELGLIKMKMAQLGIENRSDYLRKMAIDAHSRLSLTAS